MEKIRSILRLIKKFLRWYFSRNRKLNPPPTEIKRYLLRMLAKKYGLKTFIETGTYQGGTIQSLQYYFNAIHSIELNQDLCRKAQEKFSYNKNINIYCGDSSEILPKIVSTLKEPALFWLDAHFSAGFTSRGKTDTPIRDELQTILAHPIYEHIIVIDDARDFGRGDYPTIEEIVEKAIKYGRKVRVQYNMIIIEKDQKALPYSQTSQFGEDAIIERLLSAIGVQQYECIEFGAWDGFRGSNTVQLWSKDKHWRAFLIEARPERYKQLVAKTKEYNVTCLNARISGEGELSIDALSQKYGFGPNIDILSIDIDGDDYWIFQSLQFLKPEIIICEYNPTIPLNRSLIGAPGSRIGCSAHSLKVLAKQKGYVLCGATQSNLIFSAQKNLEKIQSAGIETDSSVKIPEDNLRYIISDYDGNYVFDKQLTYGIRAPKKPRLFSTDIPFFVPHPFLSPIIAGYNNLRKLLYGIRKNIL